MGSWKSHSIAIVFLAFVLCATSGCHSTSTPKSDHENQSASKRYHLDGDVLALNAATGEITVRHGDIPGFMPAMTMIYKLKDPSKASSLKPGDHISADVVAQTGSDDFLLDSIDVTAHGVASDTTLAQRQLAVGDTVPDVQLINQDGKSIHLRMYRGRALLLTFIYTRCPMPKACPLISSRFARVHLSLAADPKVLAGSHMLSVSLDPAYDKAEVLRRYGLAYLDDNPAGFAHWEFAATTPEDLRKLAGAFGLEYSVQGNQITHTMQTVLIAPDGTVANTWAGSGWSEEEVANAVRSLVNRHGR